jgi:hypothetical protein
MPANRVMTLIGLFRWLAGTAIDWNPFAFGLKMMISCILPTKSHYSAFSGVKTLYLSYRVTNIPCFSPFTMRLTGQKGGDTSLSQNPYNMSAYCTTDYLRPLTDEISAVSPVSGQLECDLMLHSNLRDAHCMRVYHNYHILASINSLHY